MSSGRAALEIDQLRVGFRTREGEARVVNDVSISVGQGEIHGLVGESGSGKSVTARAVLGLLPKGALSRLDGAIRHDGMELLELSDRQLRDRVRGTRISMVFQDPMTALNPVMRIGVQLTMPMRAHLGLSKREAAVKALDLLTRVGVPEPHRRIRAYPHQLSGGQRQRVMIAIALSCDPAVLIADEPTTALDVSIQAQIMDLFHELREARGLAILLVSHDLTLIAERCDAVSVMYAGRIVETGPGGHIFREPMHPYTHLLEAARPRLDGGSLPLLATITGSPPDLWALPVGCSFVPRCPFADERCASLMPSLEPIATDRTVRCHHPLSDSPPRPEPLALGTPIGDAR